MSYSIHDLHAAILLREATFLRATLNSLLESDINKSWTEANFPHTPLYCAVQVGNHDAVTALLEILPSSAINHSFILPSAPTLNISPLSRAILNHDNQMVATLVHHGASIDLYECNTYDDLFTHHFQLLFPLMACVLINDSSTLSFLLNADRDLEKPEQKHLDHEPTIDTPSHIAVNDHSTTHTLKSTSQKPRHFGNPNNPFFPTTLIHLASLVGGYQCVETILSANSSFQFPPQKFEMILPGFDFPIFKSNPNAINIFGDSVLCDLLQSWFSPECIAAMIKTGSIDVLMVESSTTISSLFQNTKSLYSHYHIEHNEVYTKANELYLSSSSRQQQQQQQSPSLKPQQLPTPSQQLQHHVVSATWFDRQNAIMNLVVAYGGDLTQLCTTKHQPLTQHFDRYSVHSGTSSIVLNRHIQQSMFHPFSTLELPNQTHERTCPEYQSAEKVQNLQLTIPQSLPKSSPFVNFSTSIDPLHIFRLAHIFPSFTKELTELEKTITAGNKSQALETKKKQLKDKKTDTSPTSTLPAWWDQVKSVILSPLFQQYTSQPSTASKTLPIRLGYDVFSPLTVWNDVVSKLAHYSGICQLFEFITPFSINKIVPHAIQRLIQASLLPIQTFALRPNTFSAPTSTSQKSIQELLLSTQSQHLPDNITPSALPSAQTILQHPVAHHLFFILLHFSSTDWFYFMVMTASWQYFPFLLFHIHFRNVPGQLSKLDSKPSFDTTTRTMSLFSRVMNHVKVRKGQDDILPLNEIQDRMLRKQNDLNGVVQPTSEREAWQQHHKQQSGDPVQYHSPRQPNQYMFNAPHIFFEQQTHISPNYLSQLTDSKRALQIDPFSGLYQELTTSCFLPQRGEVWFPGDLTMLNLMVYQWSKNQIGSFPADMRLELVPRVTMGTPAAKHEYARMFAHCLKFAESYRDSGLFDNFSVYIIYSCLSSANWYGLTLLLTFAPLTIFSLLTQLNSNLFRLVVRCYYLWLEAMSYAAHRAQLPCGIRILNLLSISTFDCRPIFCQKYYLTTTITTKPHDQSDHFIPQQLPYLQMSQPIAQSSFLTAQNGTQLSPISPLDFSAVPSSSTARLLTLFHYGILIPFITTTRTHNSHIHDASLHLQVFESMMSQPEAFLVDASSSSSSDTNLTKSQQDSARHARLSAQMTARKKWTQQIKSNFNKIKSTIDLRSTNETFLKKAQYRSLAYLCTNKNVKTGSALLDSVFSEMLIAPLVTSVNYQQRAHQLLYSVLQTKDLSSTPNKTSICPPSIDEFLTHANRDNAWTEMVCDKASTLSAFYSTPGYVSCQDIGLPTSLDSFVGLVDLQQITSIVTPYRHVIPRSMLLLSTNSAQNATASSSSSSSSSSTLTTTLPASSIAQFDIETLDLSSSSSIILEPKLLLRHLESQLLLCSDKVLDTHTSTTTTSAITAGEVFDIVPKQFNPDLHLCLFLVELLLPILLQDLGHFTTDSTSSLTDDTPESSGLFIQSSSEVPTATTTNTTTTTTTLHIAGCHSTILVPYIDKLQHNVPTILSSQNELQYLLFFLYQFQFASIKLNNYSLFTFLEASIQYLYQRQWNVVRQANQNLVKSIIPIVQLDLTIDPSSQVSTSQHASPINHKSSSKPKKPAKSTKSAKSTKDSSKQDQSTSSASPITSSNVLLTSFSTQPRLSSVHFTMQNNSALTPYLFGLSESSHSFSTHLHHASFSRNLASRQPAHFTNKQTVLHPPPSPSHERSESPYQPPQQLLTIASSLEPSMSLPQDDPVGSVSATASSRRPTSSTSSILLPFGPISGTNGSDSTYATPTVGQVLDVVQVPAVIPASRDLISPQVLASRLIDQTWVPLRSIQIPFVSDEAAKLALNTILTQLTAAIPSSASTVIQDSSVDSASQNVSSSNHSMTSSVATQRRDLFLELLFSNKLYLLNTSTFQHRMYWMHNPHLVNLLAGIEQFPICSKDFITHSVTLLKSFYTSNDVTSRHQLSRMIMYRGANGWNNMLARVYLDALKQHSSSRDDNIASVPQLRYISPLFLAERIFDVYNISQLLFEAIAQNNLFLVTKFYIELLPYFQLYDIVEWIGLVLTISRPSPYDTTKLSFQGGSPVSPPSTHYPSKADMLLLFTQQPTMSTFSDCLEQFNCIFHFLQQLHFLIYRCCYIAALSLSTTTLGFFFAQWYEVAFFLEQMDHIYFIYQGDELILQKLVQRFQSESATSPLYMLDTTLEVHQMLNNLVYQIESNPNQHPSKIADQLALMNTIATKMTSTHSNSLILVPQITQKSVQPDNSGESDTIKSDKLYDEYDIEDISLFDEEEQQREKDQQFAENDINKMFDDNTASNPVPSQQPQQQSQQEETKTSSQTTETSLIAQYLNRYTFPISYSQQSLAIDFYTIAPTPQGGPKIPQNQHIRYSSTNGPSSANDICSRMASLLNIIPLPPSAPSSDQEYLLFSLTPQQNYSQIYCITPFSGHNISSTNTDYSPLAANYMIDPTITPYLSSSLPTYAQTPMTIATVSQQYVNRFLLQKQLQQTNRILPDIMSLLLHFHLPLHIFKRLYPKPAIFEPLLTRSQFLQLISLYLTSTTLYPKQPSALSTLSENTTLIYYEAISSLRGIPTSLSPQAMFDSPLSPLELYSPRRLVGTMQVTASVGVQYQLLHPHVETFASDFFRFEHHIKVLQDSIPQNSNEEASARPLVIETGDMLPLQSVGKQTLRNFQTSGFYQNRPSTYFSKNSLNIDQLQHDSLDPSELTITGPFDFSVAHSFGCNSGLLNHIGHSRLFNASQHTTNANTWIPPHLEAYYRTSSSLTAAGASNEAYNRASASSSLSSSQQDLYALPVSSLNYTNPFEDDTISSEITSITSNGCYDNDSVRTAPISTKLPIPTKCEPISLPTRTAPMIDVFSRPFNQLWLTTDLTSQDSIQSTANPLMPLAGVSSLHSQRLLCIFHILTTSTHSQLSSHYGLFTKTASVHIPTMFERVPQHAALFQRLLRHSFPLAHNQHNQSVSLPTVDPLAEPSTNPATKSVSAPVNTSPNAIVYESAAQSVSTSPLSQFNNDVIFDFYWYCHIQPNFFSNIIEIMFLIPSLGSATLIPADNSSNKPRPQSVLLNLFHLLVELYDRQYQYKRNLLSFFDSSVDTMRSFIQTCGFDQILFSQISGAVPTSTTSQQTSSGSTQLSNTDNNPSNNTTAALLDPSALPSFSAVPLSFQTESNRLHTLGIISRYTFLQVLFQSACVAPLNSQQAPNAGHQPTPLNTWLRDTVTGTSLVGNQFIVSLDVLTNPESLAIIACILCGYHGPVAYFRPIPALSVTTDQLLSTRADYLLPGFAPQPTCVQSFASTGPQGLSLNISTPSSTLSSNVSITTPSSSRIANIYHPETARQLISSHLSRYPHHTSTYSSLALADSSTCDGLSFFAILCQALFGSHLSPHSFNRLFAFTLHLFHGTSPFIQDRTTPRLAPSQRLFSPISLRSHFSRLPFGLFPNVRISPASATLFSYYAHQILLNIGIQGAYNSSEWYFPFPQDSFAAPVPGIIDPFHPTFFTSVFTVLYSIVCATEDPDESIVNSAACLPPNTSISPLARDIFSQLQTDKMFRSDLLLFNSPFGLLLRYRQFDMFSRLVAPQVNKHHGDQNDSFLNRNAVFSELQSLLHQCEPLWLTSEQLADSNRKRLLQSSSSSAYNQQEVLSDHDLLQLLGISKSSPVQSSPPPPSGNTTSTVSKLQSLTSKSPQTQKQQATTSPSQTQRSPLSSTGQILGGTAHNATSPRAAQKAAAQQWRLRKQPAPQQTLQQTKSTTNRPTRGTISNSLVNGGLTPSEIRDAAGIPQALRRVQQFRQQQMHSYYQTQLLPCVEKSVPQHLQLAYECIYFVILLLKLTRFATKAQGTAFAFCWDDALALLHMFQFVLFPPSSSH